MHPVRDTPNFNFYVVLIYNSVYYFTVKNITVSRRIIFNYTFILRELVILEFVQTNITEANKLISKYLISI